jgi:hypothetical protein
MRWIAPSKAVTVNFVQNAMFDASRISHLRHFVSRDGKLPRLVQFRSIHNNICFLAPGTLHKDPLMA